jgi:hypothetical protein
MARRKSRVKKPVKQELDIAEHAAKLRAIPVGPWDTLRKLIIWLAAGILLSALGWLALGR